MNIRKVNYLKSPIFYLVLMNIAILIMASATLNLAINASNAINAINASNASPKVLIETQASIKVQEPTNTPVIIEEEEGPTPVATNTDPQELINNHIDELCNIYKNVKPELVKSIIYHESRYTSDATNGNCVGLMQISTYWHADRAAKLGVTDFYNPKDNVLVGMDYISELLVKYKDPSLVLMLYSMNHDMAFKVHAEGKSSEYAKSVLRKAEEYKRER